MPKKCSCGNGYTSGRFCCATPAEGQRADPSRCPCLRAQRSCTFQCDCHLCHNQVDRAPTMTQRDAASVPGCSCRTFDTGNCLHASQTTRPTLSRCPCFRRGLACSEAMCRCRGCSNPLGANAAASTTSRWPTRKKYARCTCGNERIGDYSVPRCQPERCWCARRGRPCYSSCVCRNCCNPSGPRPNESRQELVVCSCGKCTLCIEAGDGVGVLAGVQRLRTSRRLKKDPVTLTSMAVSLEKASTSFSDFYSTCADGIHDYKVVNGMRLASCQQSDSCRTDSEDVIEETVSLEPCEDS